MTKEDFCIASNALIYYNYNFDSKEIEYPTLFHGIQKTWMPGFFSVFPKNLIEHFWEKFQSNPYRCAVFELYIELDDIHQRAMLEYIFDVCQPHQH